MALDAALDVSSSKPPVPPPSPPRIDSWARGGRRSKRRAGSPAASDGVSGGGADVHDQSEQEYLALSLLMLSRGLRGDAGSAGAAAPTAATKAGSAQHQHQHGYECSVCGKVYASYQALGGHKTSHRKPPTPPTPSPPAPGDEASSGSGGTAHAEEKEKEKEKVHQCSLCLRTFPSGQALGGHKRLHYEGGAGDGGAKDKDKDAAAKTYKASAPTAVLRDFDLNLPAEGAPPEAKRARTMLLVV